MPFSFFQSPKRKAPDVHKLDPLVESVLSQGSPTTALRPRRVAVPSFGSLGREKAAAAAFVIENFLTAEECQALIHLSEECGYEQALVNIGGAQKAVDAVRRSGRVLLDSKSGARVLFERLEPHLLALGLEHGPRGGWRRCVELNERLRFLKYDPGDYFKPHQDGRYVRERGEEREGDESLLTLMLYLNTPEKGGSTNFLGAGPAACVSPTTGMALIFDHDLLHEGATLECGQKYCIRTDVMYTRRADNVAPRVPDADAPSAEGVRVS